MRYRIGVAVTIPQLALALLYSACKGGRMKFAKYILSLLAMAALVSATTARADDHAGEVAGEVMGAVVGGILNQAFGGRPGWPGFPGHPGHPGGPGFPGHPGWPHPGGGFPPPPPPPFPQVDLCMGIYAAQMGGGDYVQLTEQGRGYINVTSISNRQAYYGNGTCVMTGPFTAQYNFQLQFGGIGHVNQGTIYRANDGRYYLQGTQDNGPVYVYVR
jgi:hypothetical protein